jgi:GNAT superfamily N-acetyltransferase
MNFHIKELNRSTWNDLTVLFEQNRLTSQCYCLSHRVPAQDLVIEEEAKAVMKEWVCPAPKLGVVRNSNSDDGARSNVDRQRKVHGLLLYDDESPVGWISIDPLSFLAGHDAHVDAQDGEWTIHCVYLLPAYRHKAHSQQLIRAALELARSNGAAVVSAFPCPAESETGQPESLMFGGRMNSYAELGFKPAQKLSDLYQRMEYRF